MHKPVQILMTVRDLKKALESLEETMWVCSETGALIGIDAEPGANEPYVILKFTKDERP